MAQAAPRSVVRQIELLFEGGTGAGLSDRQLIDRFNARSDAAGEAAFAALVHRHGPMVLDVCQQLLGDLHHAEDAFQAVFLVLARKAGVIRDPDLLGAWLYGVAVRTARKARSRLARLRRNEGSDAMRHSSAGSRTVTEGTAPSTEQSAIHREQAAVLHEEIDRLPQSFRLPVVLCYFEGLTLDEVAHRLNWPAGTVRSRLARARDKLRLGLTRRGVVLPAAAIAAVQSPRPAAASVSSVLCQTTARAAIRFAAGHSVPASASALAGEVLRSMVLSRSGLAALAVIALAAVTAGVGLLRHSLAIEAGIPQERTVLNAAVMVAAQDKETRKTQQPAPAQKATEHHPAEATRPPKAKPLADLPPRGALRIARLRHAGDWNASPQAIPNLMDALRKARFGGGAMLNQKELTARDPSLIYYPLIYLHGREAFSLPDEDLNALRRQLDPGGGTLFADAACGSPAFDAAFRRFVARLLPDHPLVPIPHDDEIYTEKIGRDLSRCQYTRAAGGIRGYPQLEGVRVNGHWGIIYSKYGIGCVLDRDHDGGCKGYLRDDAVRIVGNVVINFTLTDRPPAQQVLHLTSGRSIAGMIRPSDRPGFLRWQAASDGSLSDFAWNEVDAIQWPPPDAWPRPSGGFRFELAAGDVLFGALRALDERRAELDIPRLGRIHVERSHLHGISRWRDGADVIYTGPNGLAGWHEPPGRKDWRNDAGRPATDRELASIRGDFSLPERASIEFEISWTSKAEFVFALGVDDKDITVKRAFRFEVWGNDLVIQRELAQVADLAVLAEVPARRPSHAYLQAYLDQAKGRILVFSPGGAQLADMIVSRGQPPVLPGLYLENTRGDMRLERLRIARWDGEIPRDVRAGQARVHRDDGSTLDGELTGLDAASRDFLLRAGVVLARIPEGRVSSMWLPAPRPEAPRMIRAVYQDGSRISGELVRVEDGALTLTAPGIQGPLRLPLAGLRSLVALRHGAGHPEGGGSP